MTRLKFLMRTWCQEKGVYVSAWMRWRRPSGGSCTHWHITWSLGCKASSSGLQYVSAEKCHKWGVLYVVWLQCHFLIKVYGLHAMTVTSKAFTLYYFSFKSAGNSFYFSWVWYVRAGKICYASSLSWGFTFENKIYFLLFVQEKKIALVNISRDLAEKVALLFVCVCR